MELTEQDLARKLLEHLHLNVAERRGLRGQAMPFSVLVEAARRALAQTPWLPPTGRVDHMFDGVLLERRDGDYWIHERHEIGVNRYSDVRSQRAESLEAALRGYLEPFNGSIDGVEIDWSGLHAREPTILNLALNLSLEFGVDWRKPITDRLLERCPALSRPEAEELNQIAADTRDYAHQIVEGCVDGKVTEEDARRQILGSRPWLDDETLERLWNQGRYYAMKR